ncbi:MAG: L-aspartate oxidase [Planctomycetes bacterium]|nr:L-aspartate oxidase [Planctomycetota bacterium]
MPSRRYLVPFDARELPLRWAGVLVLGSGVAGLSAALEAAQSDSVLIVTKADAPESNTNWAQGGIAVVLDPDVPDDSYERHAKDTHVAGVDLCDPDVVEFVVREATPRVRELIAGGACFDPDEERGGLARTKEGGHTAARILHAAGDATGREIQRTLLERTRAHPRIRFLEHAFVVDLVTHQGQCQGALVWDHGQGLQLVAARVTILAAGGAGRVFRETTNPHVATGDGIAMAYRAGCKLLDMEFMQFHPTTLYVAGAARTLLTEALRGEGAHLVDEQGVRFMVGRHDLAELAPRDIVSREIVKHLQSRKGVGVFLDLRHLDADHLRKRFPGINRICQTFGFDFTSERIPIRPSAHYTIGGVEIDENGATSVPRLFAIGEVSCSGLHGANRLASNSLLEGLVYGYRAGRQAAALATESLGDAARLPLEIAKLESKRRVEVDLEDMVASIRALSWRCMGVERDGEGLEEAERQLTRWGSYVLDALFAGPRGWELQNMLTVSALMAKTALWRTESRGAHHRLDYPERADETFNLHSAIQRPSEDPA